MANDNYQNGNVTINKCSLSSLDGKRTLNVLGQVQLIEIYESLIQPVYVATVLFNDAVGIMTNFPLIGEEILTIEFQTPGMGKAKFELYLTQYTGIEFNDTTKTRSYTGHGMSKQGVLNATKLVTKRFKDQVSGSIKTICSDFLEITDKLEVDETQGIDDLLISNLTPLQAIDMLRRRAVSAKYQSSSFVFYQDRNGFKFKTLEELVDDAKKPAIEYSYDDSLDQDITKDGRFTNILNYTPAQTASTLEKLQHGGSSNIVRRFDFVTGQVTDVAFSDSSDEFRKSNDESRQQTSTFNQKFGQSTSTKTLWSFDDKDNEDINTKFSKLPGFVNRINQDIIHILINGNSDLTVAMPVKISINASTGMTGTSNKKRTNNYTVSKIRHIINISNRSVYAQSVELLGNSFDK